jgi:hypothetical protein
MNKFANRFAAVAALATAGMSAAHAELPATIGAAVTSATADVASAGGLILGVVVAIAAVAWVRRVVK